MTDLKITSYPLSTVLDKLEAGEIATTGFGRPVKWSPEQAHDLLCSVYRGYPIGQVLCWKSGPIENGPARRLVVVDGKQRLISLRWALRGQWFPEGESLAPMTGVAFRPRDETFAVASLRTKDSPQYIPDVSVIWDGGSRGKTTRKFFDRLEASSEPVAQGEKNRIEEAIRRLYAIRNYPLGVAELGSEVSIEQVADLFVHINRRWGQRISEHEAELVWMSVWWEDCHQEVEAFRRDARDLPHKLSATAGFLAHQNLLRVATGLAFQQVEQGAVYNVLRDVDSEISEAKAHKREQKRQALKAALKDVLCVSNWHGFLQALERARAHRVQIACGDMILATYLIYLVGRCRCQVDPNTLVDAVARWICRARRNNWYGSEGGVGRFGWDLRRLSTARCGDEYVALLGGIISAIPSRRAVG